MISIIHKQDVKLADNQFCVRIALMGKQNKPASLSVIIPTYNEEQYIGSCLRSLLNQTDKPDEIIVVDNNSTDATVKIVKSFSGVKLLKESRQGQLYARKLGFDSAKSDILATIDADCIALPHWSGTVSREFAHKPIDALSGYVTSRDTVAKKLFDKAFNFMEFDFNRLMSGHHVLFGSNLAMTHRFWLASRKHLRDDTSLWEDYDLAVIGNKLGFEIGCLRDVGIDMSLRRAQIPLKQLHQYYRGWYRTFWPYNKRAAVLAFFMSFVCVGMIALMRPLMFVTNMTDSDRRTNMFPLPFALRSKLSKKRRQALLAE